MIRVVVIGAGGFGRETLDVLAAINHTQPTFHVVGVVDDRPSEQNLARLSARETGYLGTTREWLARSDSAQFIVGVGLPAHRQQIADVWESSGREPATAVHPTAVIGSSGLIGRGVVVCAGVQVSTNVHIGAYVQLNPNSTVGHDTILDDFASVNPAATISGDCDVGRGSLIGASAVVLQGRRVGNGAVVGAAACVVDDVPSHAVVKGVPAR